MFDQRVFLGAALVLCVSHAAAQPVRVAFDWPAGIPTAPMRVHIHAVWTAGSASNSEIAEVDAESGPDGAALDLGDGLWKLQSSAPGYWSQDTEVMVTHKASASVRIALWPAASLHGRILVAEGEQLPDALEVHLDAISASAGETTAQLAPVQRPEPNLSRVELRCQIDEGSWSCLGPAGQFDMQLVVVGYTPHYAWGVNLKAAESTDFGRIALLRTASVFGRAVRKNGSNPQGPCRAILRPEGMRGGSALELNAEGVHQGETIFSVPLSLRGYFQVVGVTPGKYLLDVECAAASGIRELNMQSDSETRIDPPLQLGELTLDIAVTPKADPEGRSWQLTVDATAPSLRRIADRARTSADGHWTRRGLAAGSYRVKVNSSDGTPWLQRDFKLDAGRGPLPLRLAFVRVAGRVLLSMQPVRAHLVFFNDAAGGEPVTFISDDDGRFQGVLPVAPDAKETNWVVEARSGESQINRRLEGVSVPLTAGGATAWLELELPAIAVRGSVVSDEGQPQRNVQVTFEDANRARTITSTDDAGNFELPNLPQGKYIAVAESDEGASERTAVEVVEGIEKELKLVLNSSTRVTLHVVSNQGHEPVTDATVQVWIAPGVPRSNTHTDQDGNFEVKLPSGTTEVGLTAGAPGYALKMIRMPISTAQEPASSGSDAPSDANTVILEASGGTLMLNLQPPEHTLDTPGTTYLVHNGAIEDAGTLAGWGTGQAGSNSDGPVEVEAIEPGVYALCFLEDTAELATLWMGQIPLDRCRKGSVERGQTLTLSPRMPKHP
jgi:hypothetical protein